MDRTRVLAAKEVQDTTICWQVMATVFWDAKGVFTQEKYNNWSVLCKLARLAFVHDVSGRHVCLIRPYYHLHELWQSYMGWVILYFVGNHKMQ